MAGADKPSGPTEPETSPGQQTKQAPSLLYSLRTSEAMDAPPGSNPNRQGPHLIGNMSPGNVISSLLHTEGVKNIEKAHTRRGGTATGVTAAGTRKSPSEQAASRDLGQKQVGSPWFQRNIGDQRQPVRFVSIP
ncbi:MAG: hypothetical protein M1815_006026 [Lichina confinis]|nr:MAG: hypothetical protein M1815_006026 [Lichina confinis]